MSDVLTSVPASAALRFRLLNDWQHGFPLLAEPFAAIAAANGTDPETVLGTYRDLLATGAMSRIGGVWGAGAGGAALLAALAVPPDRLDAVAAIVSAQPGVNHNYEREHRFNLWFVVTGVDADAVAAGVDAIETATGLRALRLPMRRVYRIDLGFDLSAPLAARGRVSQPPRVPVDPADAPLAALLEDGVPLVARPWKAWADALGTSPGRVQATLARWLGRGTLRRLGVIVRHHEAGFAANAMTVFDVPDAAVDACGLRLAAQPGVTLTYRRERAPGWPYNLYCMVHGRRRDEVEAAIAAAVAGAGLAGQPHEVLFSVRRFKQSGASYFRRAPVAGASHAGR